MHYVSATMIDISPLHVSCASLHALSRFMNRSDPHPPTSLDRILSIGRAVPSLCRLEKTAATEKRPRSATWVSTSSHRAAATERLALDITKGVLARPRGSGETQDPSTHDTHFV